jgi:hypothetical protein
MTRFNRKDAAPVSPSLASQLLQEAMYLSVNENGSQYGQVPAMAIDIE